jgi:hypothetical protein
VPVIVTVPVIVPVIRGRDGGRVVGVIVRHAALIAAQAPRVSRAGFGTVLRMSSP